MKNKFIEILEADLVPALGCTEPIAIAYAGAKAREVLGDFPDRLEIYASSNIIKNVKSVVVPMTNGMKGIETAAALGVIAGNAEAKLEVLSGVVQEDLEKLGELMSRNFCKVFHLDSGSTLHIIAKAYKNASSGEVEIKDDHCNIVNIVKDGKVTFTKESETEESEKYDFTLKDIYEFANGDSINDAIPIIKRQIEYNVAICEEGLKKNYGKNIGKTILHSFTHDVNNLARAYAAAGSDARMNGCAMPVIINSGSGNQGITVSVPIYVFSMRLEMNEEKLFRSVLLSNLVAIYLKKGIGKLSAYCGVVSAGCGVAAGLTYLKGGTFKQVAKAISNTVAGVSGIVCDGAKSSCAAKISSSVDAAVMAHYMALEDNAFDGGDGLIEWDIENTIKNIVRLGKDGMKETDTEIISIMLNNK